MTIRQWSPAAGHQGTGPFHGGMAPAAPMRRHAALVATAACIAIVPFVLAVVSFRRQHWHPVLDLAMIELRLRDIGTRHTPLVGVYARFGTGPRQASHPEALGLWAMFPVYRALGATATSMAAAAASVQVAAVATAVWLARRRGGTALVVTIAALLVLFLRAAGWTMLIDGWNPHLTMVWWVVFLLAVWSVSCGDAPMLCLVAVTGSFCVANHAGYVVLVGGLATASVVALVTTPAWGEPEQRRRTLRWGLVATALVIALWVPAIVDEVFVSGNLSRLVRSFGDDAAPQIGLRRGAMTFLRELNPWLIAARRVHGRVYAGTGSWVPGAVLILGWALVTLRSWRVFDRRLRRLHLVLAAASLLGVVSIAQIRGPVWYWVVLWVHGITLLAVVAVGWSVACAISRNQLDTAVRRRAPVAILGAGVLVVAYASLTYDASRADIPNPENSEQLRQLVPDTAAALDPRGRYLVTWTDSIGIGNAGFGLLNELDRRGLRVGAERPFQVAVTRHRVLQRDHATEEVRLAVGNIVERLDGQPGIRRVAYNAPDPEEWREFKSIEREVIAQLRRAHLDDVAATVRQSLFPSLFARRDDIPPGTTRLARRLFLLDVPEAVFVGAPRAFDAVAGSA